MFVNRHPPSRLRQTTGLGSAAQRLQRALRFAPTLPATPLLFHHPASDLVPIQERTLMAISTQGTAPAHITSELTQAESFRYKIRVARSAQRRTQADALVQKMYGSRGYEVQAPHSSDDALIPAVCLLVFDQNDQPVGTVTANFGGPDGLGADELYEQELQALRNRGRRLMEMTRFAIDGHGVQSARIQAALFNVSYICGKLAGFNHMVIELNPRHVPYYERYFGFAALGPQRVCPRVNAPAILLGLEFEHIQHEVQAVAGDQSAALKKNLYRHFLNEVAEQSLVDRLLSGSTFSNLH